MYALYKLSMSPKMCWFFHQVRFYVNYLILWALNFDKNKVFYIKNLFYWDMHMVSFNATWISLHKIPKFHLISWSGKFIKIYSFQRVSVRSPKSLQ